MRTEHCSLRKDHTQYVSIQANVSKKGGQAEREARTTSCWSRHSCGPSSNAIRCQPNCALHRQRNLRVLQVVKLAERRLYQLFSLVLKDQGHSSGTIDSQPATKHNLCWETAAATSSRLRPKPQKLDATKQSPALVRR